MSVRELRVWLLDSFVSKRLPWLRLYQQSGQFHDRIQDQPGSGIAAILASCISINLESSRSGLLGLKGDFPTMRFPLMMRLITSQNPGSHGTPCHSALSAISIAASFTSPPISSTQSRMSLAAFLAKPTPILSFLTINQAVQSWLTDMSCGFTKGTNPWQAVCARGIRHRQVAITRSSRSCSDNAASFRLMRLVLNQSTKWRKVLMSSGMRTSVLPSRITRNFSLVQSEGLEVRRTRSRNVDLMLVHVLSAKQSNSMISSPKRGKLTLFTSSQLLA